MKLMELDRVVDGLVMIVDDGDDLSGFGGVRKEEKMRREGRGGGVRRTNNQEEIRRRTRLLRNGIQ